MSNNNQSIDLSRFNDKYLKCIVTKRKSSMNILKDQGAVIIYQNSGINHLYLGNEFIAAGWGFKSKEDLNKAETIIETYDSDINSINENIENINDTISDISNTVNEMNDKINPTVYIYDKNHEKVELHEVFFTGIPAFYEDFEITDIEKIIIYNNSQILKIKGDQNVIDLPLGSTIKKVTYNISCNIHDCGGVKEVNLSYFSSSDDYVNNIATPMSINNLQWQNLDKNKVLSITHEFITPYRIDKDENLTVINNILISINGTVPEQYKKYPELTLSNNKFEIYSLENILNDHNINIDPLIIRPIPFIRYYMFTGNDINTYSTTEMLDIMNNPTSQYSYKGNVMLDNYSLGQSLETYIPIHNKSTKIINLFIPKSFELHELTYVTSTNEYNWTGAVGILKETDSDLPILLKMASGTFIEYNLYQIRISKVIDPVTFETMNETGRLKLSIYMKKTDFSKDIYELSPSSIEFNEPSNWDLLYNECFTRDHWISYNSNMDELEDKIIQSYKCYNN